MPTLDFQTLIFTSAMLSAASLLPLLMLGLVFPQNPSVRRWCWASLALTAGSLLIGLRGALPNLVSVVVGNLLYVAGTVGLLEGVLDYVDSPYRRKLLAPSLLFTALCLVLFTYVHLDLAARIVTVSLVLAVPQGLGVLELLRAPQRTVAVKYLAAVYAAGAALCLVRAAGTPVTELQPQLFANQHWFHTSLVWVYQGIYVATVAGLGLILVERLTEELRSERASFASESQRLRDVIDNSPGVVWECRPDTFDLTFVSKKAEAMSGYSVEEWMTPGAWGAMMHPDDAAEALAYAEEMVKAGKDYVIDYRIVAKDGRVVWVNGVVTLVRDASGRPTHVRGVVVDITDRKRLECELVQAKEAAERADRAKSQFLAHMSHELRTPLNGVVALLDVALTGELSAEQRETLTVAGRSAGRLMEILNDILDVSRIEAGRVRSERAALSPEELLQGLAALFQAQAMAKGLRLTLHTELPARVLMDGRHVGQVVTNLLSNAVKYTDEGGVTLRAFVGSATPRAATLCVEVEDTGPGIAASQRDEVFNAFERAGSEGAHRKPGVGLGLAISKQLAGLMGGQLSAHCGASGGALFRLEVPVEVLTDPVAPPEALPLLSESGFSVLVVEDDSINRYVFTRMFGSLGLDIQTAETGEQALERLRGGLRPDAIFIDIRLPGLDGHETARQARAILGEACPPLIALTANAYPHDREAAQAAGMELFLEKPLRIDALRSALAVVQREHRAAKRS